MKLEEDKELENAEAILKLLQENAIVTLIPSLGEKPHTGKIEVLAVPSKEIEYIFYVKSEIGAIPLLIESVDDVIDNNIFLNMCSLEIRCPNDSKIIEGNPILDKIVDRDEVHLIYVIKEDQEVMAIPLSNLDKVINFRTLSVKDKMKIYRVERVNG